jgi:dienelactone hydrolase
MSSAPLPGYERRCFTHEGASHDVYRAGSLQAPPLLLLHELPGVAPGLLLFAERLLAAGFQVHIPHLFGVVGQRQPLRNIVRLCVSREFAYLRAGVSAPVTRWLRALVAQISADNAGGNVGVIGMCLTGAFVIPLILHPSVVAAVAAQPSVPLSALHLLTGSEGGEQAAALNVSADDIAAARMRLQTGESHLLAVRCRADRLCPADKLQRLQQEFPVGLQLREYGTEQQRNAIGARPHAIYTKEYRLANEADADHPSRQAYADLLLFLRTHLPLREPQ